MKRRRRTVARRWRRKRIRKQKKEKMEKNRKRPGEEGENHNVEKENKTADLKEETREEE